MNGRDNNGRFVKGNKAAVGNNGGRPPKKREERYLEIALSTCTFENWKKIIQKATEQAMRGDDKARKWLSDILIGPPAQIHKHEGTDGDPIKMEHSGSILSIVEYGNDNQAP